MKSDFVPEKMKKAKWVLTKNLEIAQEKEEALRPKIPQKQSWWYWLKLRIEWLQYKLFGL